MHIPLPRMLTASIAVLAALAATAPAAEEDEKIASLSATPLTVTVKPGAEARVKVTLTPVKGAILYRHMTRLELADAGKVTLGKFSLPAGKKKYDENFRKNVELYTQPTSFDVPLRAPAEISAGPISLKLRVHFQGCRGMMCSPPDHVEVQLTLSAPATPVKEPQPDPQPGPKPEPEPEPKTNPEPDAQGGATAESGAATSRASSAKANTWEAWTESAIAGGGVLAVLAALVAGLLVSFTPCVYPMIPVTVALIGGTATGKDGVKRKSTLLLYTLVYVLGISITYAVLGGLAGAGGKQMREIMQRPELLLGILGVMVLLALSMFGAFELQMPAAITGKLGRFQGAGSLPMLLLSGIILGLVASPCISGPIAFLIIAIGKTGNVLFGAVSMFAFAWGMSALLIVAGLFPGLLSRPGPWMLWVKIIFGVVMTLAGLYFARTVLPLAIFRPLPLALVTAAAIGLLVACRWLKDGGKARGWIKASGSVLAVIGFYLAFGTMVANGGVSWVADRMLPGAVAVGLRGENPKVKWQPYSPAALKSALASGKPVIVDFYGDWCTYCRDMEREVFSQPEVIAELDRFVRLKVDASTTAPKEPVQEAQKRFEVTGYPTMVFFTSDGELVQKIEKALDADDFLAKAREVR